jgi:aryl-alcohol dehydrogenase-like predicted oxidoreductase
MMKFKRLGRTGLRVPAVALGCGNFGGIGSAPSLFGKGESESEAFAVMDAALEMGITLFDTANAYGGGRSETYVGNWLRAKGSRVRDQLLVSTKVLNPTGPGSNDRGLSRGHIMRQIDASLGRLRTDHVDMYLIHGPDPDTPIDETLRAFDDIVRAGKTRYIGACNMTASGAATALAVSDRLSLERFGWIQNNYSLLERGDEREVLPFCAIEGLGYTPFSPLAGGWLTGKYRVLGDYPPGSRMTLRPGPYADIEQASTFAGLDLLRAEAARRGVSMAGLSLAWVISHPVVTAPIIGPRRPEHLDPVREAMTIELTAEERGRLANFFL